MLVAETSKGCMKDERWSSHECAGCQCGKTFGSDLGQLDEYLMVA